MKRFISLIVVLTTLLSYCVCPIVVNAEVVSGTCGNNATWALDDSGTLTISGTGKMDGYGVSAHKLPWYYARSNIKNVIISEGITVVCEYAFYNCSNLSNVSFPDSLKEIGYGAFMNCSNLKNIVLPDLLEQIGSNAFQSTGISNIIIPPNITVIEYATFAWCNNLKTISIPIGMTAFRNQAFLNCYNLKDIYYEGTNEDWNKITNSWNIVDIDYGNDSIDKAKIHYNEYIRVLINGKNILFNQPPVIVDGRTLVPLRAIFEAMGASVDWNNSTKTATSKLGSTTIQLTIGSNLLYKNGTAAALDVPAQLINGYTMVPVRAVAEAFGADVNWDGATQTVYITTKGNTYSINTVPQITYDGYTANFADFNGMYIDSFTHKTNSNGTENVKFDVYNTQYIYGIVEIYNANGDLTNIAIIDKMSNSTSIKDVLIDDTGNLIRDIWNGTALTYRQESGYSKKTSINIDIPKGGYIKITNDMSESFIASVINLSDMVFAAKNTFSTLSGFNSDTSKDFVYKLSLKLIKETAFSEAIKTPKKFTDKLWKGVGKELFMNSESIGSFLDTVSKNLDEFADGELAELVLSTATNCGIGIAEGTFEALAGPVGVALKAMFTIASVTDFLLEMKDGLDCLYQGSININAN